MFALSPELHRSKLVCNVGPSVHLPTAIKSVTVNPDVWEVPYPPLGFYAFAEHQLGNGDVYGLYWPIGHEDREPIVGETYHDEWSLKPHFSSLDRFLAAAGDDDDAHVDPPDPTADSESPTACVQRAREAVKTNNVEGAIRSLEAAVSLIPEYTEVAPCSLRSTVACVRMPTRSGPQYKRSFHHLVSA